MSKVISRTRTRTKIFKLYGPRVFARGQKISSRNCEKITSHNCEKFTYCFKVKKSHLALVKKSHFVKVKKSHLAIVKKSLLAIAKNSHIVEVIIFRNSKVLNSSFLSRN